MDRETWHAAVLGVAESETGLSDWTEYVTFVHNDFFKKVGSTL